MNELQSVLLDVWREACRHIEIRQSTQTIAAILGQHMLLREVLVRQIDPQRRCLETVAVGSTSAEESPLGEVRTECSPSQIEALLQWSRRGEVVHHDGRRPRGPELDLIVPRGIAGPVLAGPLRLRGDRYGVLVLAVQRGAEIDQRHLALARGLLEPFSAALDNEHRIGEMAALREAAEAEKQSLLTRLGRKALMEVIVGAGSGLRGVMERVELVARSDLPVLIFGETGSGKEVIARAIHNRSSRPAGPFIRVNCGAIPPELIDSQLFGHERGAFTGAVETRKGWFERAHGGTLLLDEIGELPPAAQVRLLRILQDGWLERVGGHQPTHVDVRIVAATHRDLAAMVAEGRFREDLWYRIAVFPIVLPPLRERREDIAELARNFAERAATRFGLYHAAPTEEDLELLRAYNWPGNVRELATVIDRAAILGEGRRLEVAKALGVATSPLTPAAEGPPPKATPAAPGTPLAPLNQVIRQHIESALAAAKGRIEGPFGAAALLKINPHTLRAKMRKLGIDWQQFRPPRVS